MQVETATDLINAIRRSGVLEPDQRAILDRAAAVPSANARAVAKELIRRGVLTPYQANQFLLGNGQSLLLGSYVLLERLGEGGMGQVFKARHQKLGRVVALKVIRKEKASSRQTVRRFRREIKAAAQLAHPNIVLAYDADQAGDVHFLVMEYVDGTDLNEMVKRDGPLPVDRACEYIRQAAEALQHAHERGLVHRDIKPANLLVTKAGGQVKLLDLGLARLNDGTNDDSGTVLTTEGKIVGTVDFLSPEQATNSRRVDIRADLYSLGCTFYYVLSGRLPFPEGGPLEKLANHRWEEPEPLEKLRPEVPAGVVAVVRKLMAKKPEDRYQTPAELAAALTAASRAAVPVPATVAAAPAVPVAAAASAVPVAMPVATPVRGPAAVPVAAPFAPPPLLARRRRAGAPPWLLAAGGLTLLGGLALIAFLVVPRAGGPAAGTDRAGSALRLADRFTNSVNMPLLLVRESTFTMGSPDAEPGRAPDEGPPHEVVLTQPFYIATQLVTQAQYQEVMGTNPSHFNEKTGGGPNHPVEQVTWEDAVAFCRRLSDRPAEKKEGRHYRLPTEAEWEYACRAGSKKAYCFGDDVSVLELYAWYGQDPKEGATRPVGQLKANAWGLYDVHGNVWEWCQDWYDKDYYARAPKKDPQGPEVGAVKVCRGGGWDSPAETDVRAARRGSGPPTTAFRNTGFRVVCLVGRR